MSETKDDIQTSETKLADYQYTTAEVSKSERKAEVKTTVHRTIDQTNQDENLVMTTIHQKTDGKNMTTTEHYSTIDKYSPFYGNNHREETWIIEQKTDRKDRPRHFHQEKTNSYTSQPSSLAEAGGYTDGLSYGTKQIEDNTYDKKGRLRKMESHWEHQGMTSFSHDEKTSIKKDGDVKKQVGARSVEGNVEVYEKRKNKIFSARINANGNEFYSKSKNTKRKQTSIYIRMNENGDIEGTKSVMKKDSENAQNKITELKNAEKEYKKMKKRADKDVKKATNAEHKTVADYAQETVSEKRNMEPLDYVFRAKAPETAERNAQIIEERKPEQIKAVEEEKKITAEDVLRMKIEQKRIK